MSFVVVVFFLPGPCLEASHGFEQLALRRSETELSELHIRQRKKRWRRLRIDVIDGK